MPDSSRLSNIIHQLQQLERDSRKQERTAEVLWGLVVKSCDLNLCPHKKHFDCHGTPRSCPRVQELLPGEYREKGENR